MKIVGKTLSQQGGEIDVYECEICERRRSTDAVFMKQHEHHCYHCEEASTHDE